MKVLFISHDASRSGAPLALLQEIKNIKCYCPQIEVSVLFLNGGEVMDDFRSLCPIYKGWPVYSIAHRIQRKIWEERIDYPYLYMFKDDEFDCIYANSVASFKAATKLKEKLKVPIIGHVHESECALNSYQITKELLSEFSVLIAVSQLTAKNLKELYAIHVSRIVIQHPVSPWVESYLDSKITIEPMEKNNNQIIVGIFCNGTWWKSTELIPLVIKDFQDKYPQNKCHFMIVGLQNETIQYQLEYDMSRMHIAGKVTWVGKSSAPMNYHSIFDIFLLLSREDSFPLAAMEAAIMKTPIVGFEGVTGAEEWIREGAGFLVPYMDLNALSGAIYKLSVNAELRQQMGDKAYSLVSLLCAEDCKMKGVIDALNRIQDIIQI